MTGFKSIRRQLSFSLLIGTGTLVLISGAFIDTLLRSHLGDQFDRALLAKAMALVTLTTQENGAVEFDFADEFMPEFEAPESPEYFQLWLGDGTLIERSHSLGASDLPNGPLKTDRPVFADVILPNAREGRLVRIRFTPHSKDAPNALEGGEVISNVNTKARFSVARGTEELSNILGAIRLMLTGVGASLFLLTALVIRFAVKRGLRPLTEISRKIADLDASSLNRFQQTESSVEELAPIVKQLNQLLSRLDGSFQREKRFSGNVAHELRSPLSALRTIVEVSRKQPENQELIKNSLKDLLEVTEDMEKITVSLLTLARYDAGQHQSLIEKINLRAAIQKIWSLLSQKAHKKAIGLALDVDNELFIETDRSKLELMLSNLLDNAIEYSPGGEVVKIGAEENPQGTLAIVITNPTGDLHAEDLPLLFDRFWCKDKSRSDSHHAGLGLALVQALANILQYTAVARLDGELFTIQVNGIQAV